MSAKWRMSALQALDHAAQCARGGLVRAPPALLLHLVYFCKYCGSASSFCSQKLHIYYIMLLKCLTFNLEWIAGPSSDYLGFPDIRPEE